MCTFSFFRPKFYIKFRFYIPIFMVEQPKCSKMIYEFSVAVARE